MPEPRLGSPWVPGRLEPKNTRALKPSRLSPEITQSCVAAAWMLHGSCIAAAWMLHRCYDELITCIDELIDQWSTYPPTHAGMHARTHAPSDVALPSCDYAKTLIIGFSPLLFLSLAWKILQKLWFSCFSLIFIEFLRFLWIFCDLNRFSVDFHWFSMVFNEFPWFSSIFHRFL